MITGRSRSGIPPGGTAAFTITTPGSFETNGPAGTATVSEDCKTDRPAKVTFSDSPPAPTAQACNCTSVDVEPRSVSIGPSAWKLTAAWTLHCTGTRGAGCEGELRGFRWVGRPAIKTDPPRAAVSCVGKCGAKPSKGIVRISGAAPPRSFSAAVRAGRTYRLTFGSYCTNRLSERLTISVVFDARGGLDRSKSDLNADGSPDEQR
jgi:hypothetical protein